MTQQKMYNCNPNATCGCFEKSVSFNARIINGETASTQTWSWVASLKIGSNLCGGSIISDSYIMTAGHCVEGKSAYQITAYLGSTELWKGNAQQVSYIYLHPCYYTHPEEGYCLHDIALLKLLTPLNMTDKILAKVCLPKRNTIVEDNTDLMAIGWGATYENSDYVSETLQQVTLKAINSDSNWCKNIARNATIQFCAGIMPSGVKDTCQGDSGGPLMKFNEDEQWEVQGITSYGAGCGRSSLPGVYTRVGYYLDWINEIVESDRATNTNTTCTTTTTTTITNVFSRTNMLSKATGRSSNLLLAYFIAIITFC